MDRVRILAAVAGLELVAVLAACGGKVVVDVGTGSGNAGGASNGQGGAGATSGQGAAGAGTSVGGASCFTPPDPSTLMFCGGSVSSGGATQQCENDFCDQQGHKWQAVCETTTCQCLFDGAVVCTCALNQPNGNFCGGTPSCCPLPSP